MQKRVRDPRAGYFQSLEVLKAAKECGVYTKSSIMLGLGETDDEIIDTMYDLKDAVSNTWRVRPLLVSIIFPYCPLQSIAKHACPLVSTAEDTCPLISIAKDKTHCESTLRLAIAMQNKMRTLACR